MQKGITSNDEFTRFKDFLSSRNLRKTPERFEILGCALSVKGHFDVDMLYQMLEKRGYHVSRATIYSTLSLLCSCGLIRKLLFDTHQARYETASMTHSHLICTQCGEIKEIELKDNDKYLSSISFPGFTPSYASTCIYGLCSRCSRENDNTSGTVTKKISGPARNS